MGQARQANAGPEEVIVRTGTDVSAEPGLFKTAIGGSLPSIPDRCSSLK